MSPRLPVPTAGKPRRPVRRHAWSRPWSWPQLLSHIAVVYSLVCFAAVVHDDWRLAGAVRGTGLWVFWIAVLVTLGLYFYVCLSDTTYREKPVDLMSDDYEPRRCEECDTRVCQIRVKHCHMCGKCITGFDHHCRYLNTCIGLKTYKAWACFVIGLLILMATCGVGAVDILNGGKAPTPEYVACIVMATMTFILTLFLSCLLAQHLYLTLEGITTLEYVKSQNAGFPGLPPQGWRTPTQGGHCYACQDVLELTEVDDKEEIWYCTICQTDLAKAQVPFLHCDNCDEVNICMPCRRASTRPDQQVVTSKLSTLRREGSSAIIGSTLRMPSSGSSYVRRTPPRRTLSTLVIGVEGSTGDKERSFCGGRGGDAESSESSSSGDEDGQG